MSDMTKEEAIEEIKRWTPILLNSGQCTEKTSAAQDKAISALSENKGEWIPVSERLPEERQSVLVWCPQYKNIYCAYLEKEQWWIFGAFVQIVPNEVVAWMPLPEPYKAESEMN